MSVPPQITTLVSSLVRELSIYKSSHDSLLQKGLYYQSRFVSNHIDPNELLEDYDALIEKYVVTGRHNKAEKLMDARGLVETFAQDKDESLRALLKILFELPRERDTSPDCQFSCDFVNDGQNIDDHQNHMVSDEERDSDSFQQIVDMNDDLSDWTPTSPRSLCSSNSPDSSTTPTSNMHLGDELLAISKRTLVSVPRLTDLIPFLDFDGTQHDIAFAPIALDSPSIRQNDILREWYSFMLGSDSYLFEMTDSGSVQHRRLVVLSGLTSAATISLLDEMCKIAADKLKIDILTTKSRGALNSFFLKLKHSLDGALIQKHDELLECYSNSLIEAIAIWKKTFSEYLGVVKICSDFSSDSVLLIDKLEQNLHTVGSQKLLLNLLEEFIGELLTVCHVEFQLPLILVPYKTIINDICRLQTFFKGVPQTVPALSEEECDCSEDIQHHIHSYLTTYLGELETRYTQRLEAHNIPFFLDRLLGLYFYLDTGVLSEITDLMADGQTNVFILNDKLERLWKEQYQETSPLQIIETSPLKIVYILGNAQREILGESPNALIPILGWIISTLIEQRKLVLSKTHTTEKFQELIVRGQVLLSLQIYLHAQRRAVTGLQSFHRVCKEAGEKVQQLKKWQITSNAYHEILEWCAKELAAT